MDYLNCIVKGMSVGKPPRRMCPRCLSHNTKFCYHINYVSSQQRYTCKHCRRGWTHGRGLAKIDRPYVSQVSCVEKHFGAIMAIPIRTLPPMERMEVSDGSFHQGYYDAGSNDAGSKKQNQSFNNTMNMNHNGSTMNNDNNV